MAPWFDWSKNPLLRKVLFKLTKGEKRKVKKLYVGNLAWAVTDEDLQETFSEHGSVASATVITERDSGRSRGFGFVEMENGADAAIEADRLAKLTDAARQARASNCIPRDGRSAIGRLPSFHHHSNGILSNSISSLRT